jgi:prepilin-type N-terminal cleavage/methylation domain-containing protein
MQKKLGFSLIELTVTIAIASILAGVGISGYMQTLRISRRKEATIGLQRAMLINSDTSSSTTTLLSTSLNCPYGTNITIDSTSTTCLTGTGLYYLNYNVNGFDSTITDNTVINNLTANEKVIFKATAVPTKSQSKDTDCPIIYLTNMNNLYPVNCVK